MSANPNYDTWDSFSEQARCVQVCSYRVIASYESDLLEQFSLCILQKHNCLRNSKAVPMNPDPEPMATFRGAPMTHEVAEDIFIGNLAPEYGSTSSWRVVCGKNAGAPPPCLAMPYRCNCPALPDRRNIW